MSIAPDTLTHVALDDRGVAWIKGTTMKVIELAAEKRAHEVSPEELQTWHPYLSLGQVYAALSYYYDHQSDLDAEMDRSMAEFERRRDQSPNTALKGKLAESRRPA